MPEPAPAGSRADAITVDYALSPRDGVAFSVLLHRGSRLVRRAHWLRAGVFLLLAPVTVALGVILGRGFGGFGETAELPFMARTTAEMLVVYAALFWLVIPLVRRLSWHWMARSGKRAAYFRPSRLSLSPAGVAADNGLSSGDTQWPVVETCAAGVCLLVAPTHGFFVPRHAFSDAAVFDEFVALAKDLHRRCGPPAAGAVDRG